MTTGEFSIVVESVGKFYRMLPAVKGKRFVAHKVLGPLIRGRGYECIVEMRTLKGTKLTRLPQLDFGFFKDQIFCIVNPLIIRIALIGLPGKARVVPTLVLDWAVAFAKLTACFCAPRPALKTAARSISLCVPMPSSGVTGGIGSGTALLTVMETLAEVLLLPAASDPAGHARAWHWHAQ